MESKSRQMFKLLTEKALDLLLAEKWTDCRFLVGGDACNQKIISAHKLILAMASPVFELMFYGENFKEEDPIAISDIEPDAFQAMLECIYSDSIYIESFEKACKLCYAAKKYMLPHIVKHCIFYLDRTLSTKNACMTYEFAKLLDDQNLMKNSMKMIADYTLEALADPSFREIEESTLMDILNQDSLNIRSELDLFNAIIRFANYRGTFKYGTVILNARTRKCHRRYNCSNNHQKMCKYHSFEYKPPSRNDTDTSEVNTSANEELVVLEGSSSVSNNSNTGLSYTDTSEANDSENEANDSENEANDSENEANDSEKETESSYALSEPPTSPAAASEAQEIETILKKALKKIRFLTMTAQQFADGPALCKLLQLDEILAIFMNISSTCTKCSMPKGFCVSRYERF